MKFGKLVFNDIQIDSESKGYILVRHVEQSVGKNGKPYCILTVADGDFQEHRLNVWNTDAEKLSIDDNTVVLAVVQKKLYNGKPNYSSNSIVMDINNEFTGMDFAETAPIKSSVMLEGIMKIVSESGQGEVDGSLTQLTKAIFQEHSQQLMSWSAAKSVHHNILGGLLYHTYRMVQQAEAMALIYDKLDSELLVCATALHDIGKLEELLTDEFGGTTYTVEGQLLGHGILGIQMVSEKGKALGTDEEKLRCLLHCIAAHHGRPEWGTLQPPKIAEAMVVNYLDLIDSRMYQFEKIAANTEPGSYSASPSWSLDNVNVYVPTFYNK